VTALDEKVVLDNATYLYNEMCNEKDAAVADSMNKLYAGVPDEHGIVSNFDYHTLYAPRWDREIGPRSTKAAIKAIVRAINEVLDDKS
jgi:hypothetical protein